METLTDVQSEVAPQDDQVITDQQETVDDQENGDVANSDNQGITDVIPEKGDDMKKTVKGFQKAQEKKNRKIEDLELQNLNLAYKAVEADVSNFDSLDPDTQDKVAKKFGYDGIADFIRSSAPQEQNTAKQETPEWQEAHNALISWRGDELRENQELNTLLGDAFKEFQALEQASQTADLYKKIMRDAEASYLDGKKAQKTLAEITSEMKKKVAPTRSGRVQPPQPKTSQISISDFQNLQAKQRKEYMEKMKKEYGEVKFKT